MATKSKKSVQTSTVTSIIIESNVIGSGLNYFIAPGSPGTHPPNPILASGSALTDNLPVEVKVSGYDSYVVFFQDRARSSAGFQDGVVITSSGGTAKVTLQVSTVWVA
jgi:hypothetical protein